MPEEFKHYIVEKYYLSRPEPYFLLYAGYQDKAMEFYFDLKRPTPAEIVESLERMEEYARRN